MLLQEAVGVSPQSILTQISQETPPANPSGLFHSDIASRDRTGRISLLLWTRSGISSRRSAASQHHLPAAVRTVHRWAHRNLNETTIQNEQADGDHLLRGGYFVRFTI